MAFQDPGGGRAGCGLGWLWVLWHSQIPLTLSCSQAGGQHPGALGGSRGGCAAPGCCDCRIWVLEQGWVLELEQTWRQLGWGAQSLHHTTEFGAKGMLSAASERLFPRISLIQGTFSRSFRVLKHKPITPQRPPGPSGDKCCTWPCFLLLYPWRPHVAGGTEMSQHLSPGTLSPLVLPPRAFLALRASVSLLYVPPRLADSNFSTACWE